MQIVAAIPGLLALIWLIRKGPAQAFLDIYIPTLLLLPDFYRLMLPGLPDPTMNQAAIIPIGIWYFAKEGSRWKFDSTDAMVLGFCFMTAYTEYRAKNYADAQNLMFDAICSMLLPYLLTKALVEPKGLRVAFAKRMVQSFSIAGVLGIWEMKMVVPVPSRILGPFFPGQGNWAPTGRYGLIRVAGPYGHAILAGIMFCAGYRIQRWLEWTNNWQGIVKSVGMTRAKLYTRLTLMSVIITLVRGPWIGGLAGGAVLLVARAKNRKAVANVLLAVFVFFVLPAGIAFYSWASVGRAAATSTSQETAAYRVELIEKYTAVAWEHAMWGWGRGLWPKVPGLESTDNHFLLLALNHGMVTLALFLGLMFTLVARLIKFGAKRPRGDPSALLAFTLAGIYVMFTVSLATVYHGMQTLQLFFIVTGWADGVLLDYPASTAAPGSSPAPVTNPSAFHFRRVLS